MAEQYHEVVIQGRRGRLIAFIEGYLRGKGAESPPIDAEKEGFDCQPFRERIEHLLHPQLEVVHLLIPASLLTTLREVLETDVPDDIEAAIRAERPIQGARFSFSFAIHSREHAEKVRDRLHNLPPGVTLGGDTEFKVQEAPEAKGIEAYAPAHDYTFTGRGTVEGDVDGVLEVYRFCRDEDLVRQGPAQLIAADPG